MKENKENNEIMEETIPMDEIHIIKNTRTALDQQDLSELMADIKENGLLQPVGVFKKDGEYNLVYGHRRFLAMKKLGKKSLVLNKEVRVLDKELNEKDFLVLNLTENMHRVDNSPIEIAKGIKELMALGLNTNEISVRLSMPKFKIRTVMKIFSKVPEEYRSSIGFSNSGMNKKNQIPAHIADKIVGLRVAQKHINLLFEQAKKGNLNAGDIDLIGRLLSTGKSFEEILKMKENLMKRDIRIIVKKDKFISLLEKEENFSSLVRDILVGKRKPMPELFY